MDLKQHANNWHRLGQLCAKSRHYSAVVPPSSSFARVTKGHLVFQAFTHRESRPEAFPTGSIGKVILGTVAVDLDLPRTLP
jgi:hypothetical protein